MLGLTQRHNQAVTSDLQFFIIHTKTSALTAIPSTPTMAHTRPVSKWQVFPSCPTHTHNICHSCCCMQVLTDVALQHLATLPNLRHLFLTGCPLVTAQGLHHLLMYCQHLESVSLYSCTAIHADVAEAVQQAVWRGTGRKVAVHWRAGRGDGRVDNHRRPNPSSRT